MTPSETLLAAADRIKDLAAATTPGPWAWRDPGGHVKYALMAGRQMVVPSSIPDVYPQVGDARWIAALSPAAVAEPITIMLRFAAKVCADAERDGWDAERIWAEADESMRAAFDLAALVLGEETDQ